MKSYLLRVVVEPDQNVWRAYVPELEARGAATRRQTRDEALRSIHTPVRHARVHQAADEGARRAGDGRAHLRQCPPLCSLDSQPGATVMAPTPEDGGFASENESPASDHTRGAFGSCGGNRIRLGA